jgi:DNA-3-methyladenine glycosylase I
MENKTRCSWCLSSDLYKEYHDNEWGKPVFDDAVFFEFLILETFQAGLSWITILKKREHFRTAFDNFDYQIIANYNEEKVQELMQNPGIIRNQLKVRSAISNAVAFMKIQSEKGSFNKYIWDFVDNKQIVNQLKSHNEILSTTELSDKISKDLKKRGFKFVGSTVVYAFMQATGLVDDHIEDCWVRTEI